MDGYPDPDDEFEMMHAADMEAMDAMDDDEGPDDFDFGSGASKRAKKSLSFVKKPSNPSAPAEAELEAESLLNSSITGIDDHTSRQVPVAPEPSLQHIQDEINKTVSTRKRKACTTAEDLFGDIEDIEREEFYTSTFDFSEKDKEDKEKDIELEEDLLLIARIRQERQKILAESSLLPSNEKRSEHYNSHRSEYISDRVPRYPFVTMRNNNLDKFYLRLKSEDYLASEIANVKAKNTSLLPSNCIQTWKEAKILLEKMKSSRLVPQQPEDDNMTDVEGLEGKPVASEKLWVEKYQPKGYRDLLSDESTNKIVLRWLKMWDHIVFNTKMPVKKIVHNPEPTFGASKFPLKTLDQEFDSYNRPKQKIALLCGPPGLGKTTLAHVLAKHAGYNPVEVNASDDSSADSFRQVLEASTQMRSVLGDNPRPNCLILDEIDGTPIAAIEVLLKFIMDKDIAKGKKKKGSKPQILKRPIICICNDLYVPALRQLRQQALIINFPPTAAPRLAQRLIEVSKKEQLKTDLGTMLMLCDKTGSDIRSCLSFLHFFKTQNKVVRLTDVQNASVGQKDSQKGLFAVWHEIFQITKPKNSMATDNTQRGRLFRTVRLIQSYGEYEFLSNGVYENYLHMKMKESGFKTIAYGSDWFCCFDLFNTMIKQQQNYSLMPYLPYCFATWHLLYAGLAWPKINFPSKHIEAKNKTVQNVATLASVLKGMNPSIRSGVKGRELLTDTLPIMLHVIIPNLKAVNAQLLSAEEKTELQRVVNIFLQFSLSFVQERTAAGEMLYRLEPNLPELVQFPDVQPAPPMIYAVKQLVGHQVDSEKLRRSNIATGTHHVEVDITPTRVTEKSQKKADKVLPNHLQTLSPQILKKGPLKPGLKNWLSISKPVQTASQVLEEKEYQRSGLSQIVFCYKEGYSNAVRKTMKIFQLQ